MSQATSHSERTTFDALPHKGNSLSGRFSLNLNATDKPWILLKAHGHRKAYLSDKWVEGILSDF